MAFPFGGLSLGPGRVKTKPIQETESSNSEEVSGRCEGLARKIFLMTAALVSNLSHSETKSSSSALFLALLFSSELIFDGLGSLNRQGGRRAC